MVVNWETSKPGNSAVSYGPTRGERKTVKIHESVALHHVEIPLDRKDATYHYSVSTGDESSDEAAFKGCPTTELRVAVVAAWQRKPELDALLRDDPHLLLTAADNIANLHRLCRVGVKDCTEPYGELIDTYPELFRSTPFMPVLGNHDREAPDPACVAPMPRRLDEHSVAGRRITV